MDIYKHLLLIVTYISSCNAQQKCSAMNSYIELTSRITDGETLWSSQALFPPNTYYIQSSPIISLSLTENICNISQITTDITDKILLISTTDICSDYYKTYVAQQKGAIAVIIGLDETVYPIPGETDISNATIPTRGVDKWTLQRLQRMLDAGNVNPQIEFGCDYEDIPLQLCVVDIEGDYWWMDGDYVRQIAYNEHDVWMREGQYYTADETYIFLHNGETINEWYWAITTDSTFQDDTSIVAYCNNGNETISLPTDCTVWNIQSRWSRRRRRNPRYTSYSNLTVRNGSCIFPDNYMCVKSTQSNLAGLDGTYRLFNKNVPFWYRETTQCDNTPGTMFWMRRRDNFFIYSGSVWEAVAQCGTVNWTIDYMMNPQLCEQWDTISDNTLDRNERVVDNTFQIIDNKCIDEMACDATIEPANSVCVYRNSVSKLSSMLEGTYVETDYDGEYVSVEYVSLWNMTYGSVEYVSVEYVRHETANINGELYTPYLYYLGGFSEDMAMERWVLSNVSVSEYNDSTSLIYGYVHCLLMNVADCQAPWILYWNNSVGYTDIVFQIKEDDCPVTTPFEPTYGDEYDYLCIDIGNFTSIIDILDPYRLIGAYEIQRDGDFIYWSKPVNDYTDDETYIYYDTLYGHWQISTSLTTMQTGLVCMSDVLYPDNCDRWYTSDSCNSWTRRRRGTCMKTLDTMIAFRTNTCSYNDILSRSCSAMHSWLQLSGSIEKTVASAHTLFAPYKYRVKLTEIVLLDNNDNPCDLNGIENSNIVGKIVLLYTKTSIFSSIKCSDHYQLYVMQQNNANAVIMSSNDNTLSVIADDDSIDIDTYIPMRGITLNIADEIKNSIENGNIIYGEFKCNDSYEYPLEICASNVGLDVYGNFILQTKWKDNNGHPIWMRKGYSLYNMYIDLYLYLHNDNGENNYWYWAITTDITMADETAVIAYCDSEQTIQNNNLIIDPTQCTKWQKRITESEWSLINMNIYEGICNVSDQYFCISSEQSALAGLSGTYRLYYENEPVWFREWDNCDNAPAIFYYSYGKFSLFDPMDNWQIATCYMGDEYDDKFENILKFRPDLCSEWRSVIDGSLDERLLDDKTLEIKNQIDCSINCTYTSRRRFAPNRLCLQKNSIMHSFLEGQYIFTGVRGPNYRSKEYELNKPLIYDGKKINVYLWFWGEINERHQWWVISSNNLSMGENNEQNFSSIYGYGACSVTNPINCDSNWNFYWSGMESVDGAWHNDDEFSITSGICPSKNNTEINYGEMYNYICIDIISEDFEGNNIINMLGGGYEKMDTFNINVTGNNTPIWRKPANDYINMDVYIYYDKFYGYWQIGTDLMISNPILICHNNNILYPEKCNEWYDLYSKSFDNIIDLRADGCTYKDMLNKRANNKTDNTLATAIIVFIIIVSFIICITISYCIYLRFCKKTQKYESFKDNNHSNNHTEMTKKEKKIKKRKGHTQLANEDSNDDSNENDNILTNIKKEGYDMTPLQYTNGEQSNDEI